MYLSLSTSCESGSEDISFYVLFGDILSRFYLNIIEWYFFSATLWYNQHFALDDWLISNIDYFIIFIITVYYVIWYQLFQCDDRYFGIILYSFLIVKSLVGMWRNGSIELSLEGLETMCKCYDWSILYSVW